ncbi:hypothetical protein CNY67_11870 [Desulfovibrio sp. G11]|nr:hypothetical protein CNY67_11870 [Desulfovibrio sp. G11]
MLLMYYSIVPAAAYGKGRSAVIFCGNGDGAARGRAGHRPCRPVSKSFFWGRMQDIGAFYLEKACMR